MKVLSLLMQDDNAAKDNAFAAGVHVGGSRYVLARLDDGSLYARLVCLRSTHTIKYLEYNISSIDSL